MFKRLIIAGIFVSGLTACNQDPPADCPIAVHPSESVKAWLKQQEPFPDNVREYFKQLGDEQDAIEKHCP